MEVGDTKKIGGGTPEIVAKESGFFVGIFNPKHVIDRKVTVIGRWPHPTYH